MRWIFISAVVLLGCLPQASGPEDIVVVDLVDGEYQPVVRTVPLQSLDPLSSRYTFFERGGYFVRNSGEGSRVEEESELYSPWVERAIDGTLVPNDADGLWSFCFISHLEHTIDRIDSLGLDVGPTRPFLVLLNPTVLIDDRSFVDNMAYAYGSQAFILAPMARLDALPLACNHGVVAHEYGHAITERVQPYVNSFEASAVREGFADVIAAGVTGLPRVIDPSFPMPARDLRPLRRAQTDVPSSQFYVHGSVFASVFWAYKSALEESGQTTEAASDEMLRTAIEAMRTFDGEGVLSPERMVLAAIPIAADRIRFCAPATYAYRGVESIEQACQ